MIDADEFADPEEGLEEVEQEVKKPVAKSDTTRSKRVSLTQVVTGTAPGYKLPDGKVVSLDEFLVWMANNILEIRRAVG